MLKTQRVAENVITDLRSVRNMPRATELRAEVGGRAGGVAAVLRQKLMWVPCCKVWCGMQHGMVVRYTCCGCYHSVCPAWRLRLRKDNV